MNFSGFRKALKKYDKWLAWMLPKTMRFCFPWHVSCASLGLELIVFLIFEVESKIHNAVVHVTGKNLLSDADQHQFYPSWLAEPSCWKFRRVISFKATLALVNCCMATASSCIFAGGESPLDVHRLCAPPWFVPLQLVNSREFSYFLEMPGRNAGTHDWHRHSLATKGSKILYTVWLCISIQSIYSILQYDIVDISRYS